MPYRKGDRLDLSESDDFASCVEGAIAVPAAIHDRRGGGRDPTMDEILRLAAVGTESLNGS
jgi:hypothetical protein